MIKESFLINKMTRSETWVPMGPHRLGSQRSLSSGPDLPEALPTCKWAR
jgi:hypothetical protein